MKLAAAFLALTLSIVSCADPASQQTIIVDPQGASELITTNQNLVVLDIRTPEEVAEGTLSGAQNIDFYGPDFEAEIAALDRDSTYLVYCRSGNRSERATAMMAELGFTSVYELDGGIVAWVEEGRILSQG